MTIAHPTIAHYDNCSLRQMLTTTIAHPTIAHPTIAHYDNRSLRQLLTETIAHYDNRRSPDNCSPGKKFRMFGASFPSAKFNHLISFFIWRHIQKHFISHTI
jgi:hypothetical protein